MKDHVQAHGRPRRDSEAALLVAVSSLQPALASIPEAGRYLGGLSRSRLYELLPHLEVVKFGARTLVTIGSLDRLIAANTRPAAERPGTRTEESSSAAVDLSSRSNAAAARDKRHKTGGRTVAPNRVSLVESGP